MPGWPGPHPPPSAQHRQAAGLSPIHCKAETNRNGSPSTPRGPSHGHLYSTSHSSVGFFQDVPEPALRGCLGGKSREGALSLPSSHPSPLSPALPAAPQESVGSPIPGTAPRSAQARPTQHPLLQGEHPHSVRQPPDRTEDARPQVEGSLHIEVEKPLGVPSAQAFFLRDQSWNKPILPGV